MKAVSGFECSCGRFNKYPAYVYAHTHDILVFVCECGRKYEIFKLCEKEIPAEDIKEEIPNG